tara:strand:- start:1644 stop:1808 length:165 start_codon:yes stop_codon:yes gene_type:complete
MSFSRNKSSSQQKPILLLLLVFVLASCGNKGPLVTPEEPAGDSPINEQPETRQL